MEEKIDNASDQTLREKTPAERRVKPAASPSKVSNESFLGSLLIVLLLLLIVGATGFFGWIGYRVWQERKLAQATPSIEKITAKDPVPTVAPEPEPKVSSEPKPEAQEPVPPPTIDKATLEVKVLNGGAAKGSAGTLTEALKKVGYTKATFGNTVADFAGVTIYYAEGKEREAEALKGDVVKTYPAVKIAKAVPANKDTTVATLVVILGR